MNGADHPARRTAREVPGPGSQFRASPQDAAAARPIEPEPFLAFDPAKMPPRPCLLGSSIIRGEVTGIAAPGGSSKTSLELQRAIAYVTGKSITGEAIFRGKQETGRCWYINAEESIDEIRRRLAGICIAFGIDMVDLEGRLFIGAKGSPAITIAEMEDGNIIVKPDVDQIIEASMASGFDFVCIDPLVQFHRLSENSNSEMAILLAQLRRIAREANIAVRFAAHSRKGATAGDADGMRGATAVRDGARKLETLAAMTEDEAKSFGVEERDRRRLVRLDDAKSNYSAPEEFDTWFRREGVCLGNADDVRPADFVPVLRRIDLEKVKTANEGEQDRTAEPLRQHLAQLVSDTMTGDRCALRGVVTAIADHEGLRERAVRNRISAAIPKAPGFRAVEVAGQPYRLYLMLVNPNNPRGAIELCRIPAPAP